MRINRAPVPGQTPAPGAPPAPPVSPPRTGDIDPVRDRRPRRTVPAHVAGPVTGQQTEQEQRPREPGEQLTRYRRLHYPYSGQLSCPYPDLVHPDVVTVAVDALRVVAQQQVRVLVGQQGGQLSAASATSARANRCRPGGSSNKSGPCPLSA